MLSIALEIINYAPKLNPFFVWLTHCLTGLATEP